MPISCLSLHSTPPPQPQLRRLYACSLHHPSLSSLDTYSMVSRGVYYACIFSCIYLLGWCISCRVNDVVYNWLNIMPLMTKSLFLKCSRLSNSRNTLKTVLEKEQEITFDFHLVIKSWFFFLTFIVSSCHIILLTFRLLSCLAYIG